MKSSRVLLLDVDGVVLHQPRLFASVRQKVATYVHQQFPMFPTRPLAEEFNETLYRTYGHTQLGVRALRGKHAGNVTEFNRFVYDREMIDLLESYRTDPLVQTRAFEVQRLVRYMYQKKIPVFLFSNAPQNWCEKVLDITGMKKDFAPEMIITSDHPTFTCVQEVKPQKILYSRVAMYIQHTLTDQNSQLIFVDDSYVNLAPIMGDPTWIPIWFKPDGFQYQGPQLQTVGQIIQLHDLV